MKKIQYLGFKSIMALVVIWGTTATLWAEDCSNKLFSATIDSKLTISDVIENLADTCELSIVVRDEAAKKRMGKNLYYVKLNNSTLKGFLNTILTDNDLNYSLEGNKLKISYLTTKTFRIHYLSGQRIGKSNAHITIASLDGSGAGGGTSGTSGASGSSGSSGSASGGDKTGVSIESNDEFQFWKTIEQEIQRILVGAGDGSTHYSKTGKTWTGPEGKVWEYNPLAPIVNPEAGMVTVTGTARQISRVARYIHTLTSQIQKQVMIDVRIMSVVFKDNKTTGVDWSQLYGLQNHVINTSMNLQQDIEMFLFSDGDGITDNKLGPTTGGASLTVAGMADVKEVVKFLGTQGDVKSISSPRVMTLNNQPALISVGKEIFYKLKSVTMSGGLTPVASEEETIESVFAGILLDITPQIGSDGMITLKINPSITELVNSTQEYGDGERTSPPDLIRRQIASVIKVRDGEHAVLGGLIVSKTGMEISKVPLLGDLPLLEYAFKHERKIEEVEELVLIVTPHIVKNSKSVTLKDLGYSKLNDR